jgi:hypothetical protein
MKPQQSGSGDSGRQTGGGVMAAPAQKRQALKKTSGGLAGESEGESGRASAASRNGSGKRSSGDIGRQRRRVIAGASGGIIKHAATYLRWHR